MPRILNAEVNTLKAFDYISNSEIELYYRDPTTEERVAYSGESLQRKRNTVRFRTVQARQKFGYKILTGIRDGDFYVREAGRNKPLSSNKSNPDYDPDWKEKLAKHASDVIEVLAAHVFDASVETIDKTDIPEDEPTGDVGQD